MFCVRALKPLVMTVAAPAAAASQLDACETRAQSSAHFASHEPNHNETSTAAHSFGYAKLFNYRGNSVLCMVSLPPRFSHRVHLQVE